MLPTDVGTIAPQPLFSTGQFQHAMPPYSLAPGAATADGGQGAALQVPSAGAPPFWPAAYVPMPHIQGDVGVQQFAGMQVSMPPGAMWAQGREDLNGQREQHAKLLRRKEANRESARRSKQRKKEESEKLARKAQSLELESKNLREEVKRMTERCSALASENAQLRQQAESVGLRPPPLTITPLTASDQPVVDEAIRTLPIPVNEPPGPFAMPLDSPRKQPVAAGS